MITERVFYRGDPQRTGLVSTSGLYGTPRLRWKFESRHFKISTTPAVWQDRVYFNDLGYNNTFHCLDAIPGKPYWEFDAGRGSRSSPMVADGIVYFGTRDGRLLGLDVETGQQVWQFQADKYIASSPVIVDETIYFGSGDAWGFDTDGWLYAVDLASGEERWRFAAPEGWWNRGFSASPSIDQGVLCCGCRSGEFFALDSQSGELLWVNDPGIDRNAKERPMFSMANSTPIAQSTVYFVRNPYLYAVDLFTGAERWRFRFNPGVPLGNTKQAVAHETVYLSGYKNELYEDELYVLYALNAQTGAERWVYEPSEDQERFYPSEPVIAGDVLCFGSADQSIYGFGARTGEALWRFDTGDKDARIWTSASVQEHRLYIAAPHARKVYCLEFES